VERQHVGLVGERVDASRVEVDADNLVGHRETGGDRGANLSRSDHDYPHLDTFASLISTPFRWAT
jgi:hypothetical protein